MGKQQNMAKQMNLWSHLVQGPASLSSPCCHSSIALLSHFWISCILSEYELLSTLTHASKKPGSSIHIALLLELPAMVSKPHDDTELSRGCSLPEEANAATPSLHSYPRCKDLEKISGIKQKPFANNRFLCRRVTSPCSCSMSESFAANHLASKATS